MHPTHTNPTGPAADTDETTIVTPADTLRGAARYLETHGWMQGDYYPKHNTAPFPPACAVGAIGMAAYGRRTDSLFHSADSSGVRGFSRALDAFTNYVQLIDQVLADDFEFHPEETPFCWNDDPTRTAGEVVQALHAAADEWDRTHGGAR